VSRPTDHEDGHSTSFETLAEKEQLEADMKAGCTSTSYLPDAIKSTPSKDREAFEKWWKNERNNAGTSKYQAFNVWQAAIKAARKPVSLDKCRKAAYDSNYADKYSWESVKDMAKMKGYIAAQGVVELTVSATKAVLDAAGVAYE
jgi:hypothetical protein